MGFLFFKGRSLKLDVLNECAVVKPEKDLKRMLN